MSEDKDQQEELQSIAGEQSSRGVFCPRCSLSLPVWVRLSECACPSAPARARGHRVTWLRRLCLRCHWELRLLHHTPHGCLVRPFLLCQACSKAAFQRLVISPRVCANENNQLPLNTTPPMTWFSHPVLLRECIRVRGRLNPLCASGHHGGLATTVLFYRWMLHLWRKSA